MIFMDDLASRLAGRVQLTSDGHKAYLEAVEGAFGGDVDYAMLIKAYGPAPEGERRYSPAECIGAQKARIEGNPDPAHISTSFAERNNLNIRMHSRRKTRLINAFSKKFDNHAHAMALHFLYYNFVRVHKTLRTSPAMAAGVERPTGAGSRRSHRRSRRDCEHCHGDHVARASPTGRAGRPSSPSNVADNRSVVTYR
jgi:hypothetical protein